MKPHALQNLDDTLTLEELEAFRQSLKSCPKCGSNEGFWLTANREKSFLQCKHCGAILEICEVFSSSEKHKGFNLLALRKTRKDNSSQ
jgi:translation initiation factor 2 beta subunit (eIF-2beta)/eIF-5